MQHLTKDELHKLLRAAKNYSDHDWLMLLVGYWHGLRCSEILSLRGENISGGYLHVQRLKGSNKTIQPLVAHPDPLLNEREALTVYALSKGKRLLFIPCPSSDKHNTQRKYFWRLMQKYGKLAGIHEHKLHPHILKHSIAMHTIKEAGIENVRQYLGHKSINSTGAYLKVDDEQASQAIMKALK